MKRYMMPLLSILAGILVLGIVYHWTTTVSFSDQRASLPALSCKLIEGANVLNRPVIFIPGTKGSLLAKDGKKVWLRLSQLLSGKDELTYDPQEKDLEPIGILDRIVILPFLLESRSYHRISSTLACSEKAYFYSYDWRRNPLDNMEGLRKLVERVRNETGQKPSIITHSMGGLVTHAYMKEHADNINRVVYVGVPFNSGLTFLEDIDQGCVVALNKTILSKAAIFSHPGSFALLPHTGTNLYKNTDLMDPAVWKENKLSVYADERGDDQRLEENLRQAKAFFVKLDTPTDMANPFLFVIGNCQDTFYSIEPDGTRIMKPGDGRVVADLALPVEKDALDKRVIMSCAAHGDQLENQGNVDAILGFLRE